MSIEGINELIEEANNIQAKIFYSKFRKKEEVSMSMISPEVYVMSLKDADYETLIKERNELVELIQEFERKEKNGDRSGDEWNIMPSPEVQYQVYLTYLSELCKFMADKYHHNKSDT